MDETKTQRTQAGMYYSVLQWVLLAVSVGVLFTVATRLDRALGWWLLGIAVVAAVALATGIARSSFVGRIRPKWMLVASLVGFVAAAILVTLH